MKILTCLVGAILLCVGCSTAPITHGIPNLAEVEPGVLRGGQPNNKGWAWLHAGGFTNVVEMNDARAQEETVETEFTFHRYPISFYSQVFDAPSVDTICSAVDSITPGTFIHCRRGQDRTGLVVAEYRVWREHWPRDKARAEMLQHGFHRSLLGLNWFWCHYK